MGHKSLNITMTLTVFLFLLPSRAFASCWAVYDEAYRSTLQSAMGVSVPSRAGNFSSMQECESYLSQVLSSSEYSGDAGLQRTRCECDSGYGGSGSYAGYGGSFEAQLMGALTTSFIGGLTKLLEYSGPSAAELAQQKWAQEEKDRRQAEQDRHNKIFAQAQKDSVALLAGRSGLSNAGISSMSASAGDDGVYIGYGTVPALLRKADAVQEAEWNAVTEWQRRIGRLLSKKNLTAEELKELKDLEAKRNALWKKAINTPGLTQKDRNGLRIQLPLLGDGAPSVDNKDLVDLRDTPPEKDPPKSILTTMTEASVTFGLQTAVETWGEDAAEKLAGGKGGVLKFGDALLIGGAVKAAAKGDIEGLGEASSSWGYGKLASIIPGAGLSVGTAQGVAAVTTATFRHSWDAFITETDKVVPGVLPEGGAEEWWDDMKESQTSARRFFMGALGL